MFKRKMVTFYSVIGKKRMAELGYECQRCEFAEIMAQKVYGHLPETNNTTP